MSETKAIPKGHHRITVYRDSSLEWRWHRKAANNETISDSGEGYENRGGAIRAAEQANGITWVIPAVDHMDVLVSEEDDGDTPAPVPLPILESPSTRVWPWVAVLVATFLFGLLIGEIHGYDTGLRNGYHSGKIDGAQLEHAIAYRDGLADGNTQGYDRGYQQAVLDTTKKIADQGYVTVLCPNHSPVGMGDITGDGIPDTQMPGTP